MGTATKARKIGAAAAYGGGGLSVLGASLYGLLWAEADAPTTDQIAAAAEVLVTVRTRRQLAAAITWNAMIAIAMILTIASIILIIAGALGANL